MIDKSLRKLFNIQDPPPIIWEPEIHGRLSPARPYFDTKVRHAINNIPLEFQDKYKTAGHKIILARHLGDVADIMPETEKYVTGKGMDFGKALLEHGRSSGIYLPFDGHIVVPQIPDDYYINIPFDKWLGHDLAFVILHEVGHIFEDTEDPEQKLYLDPAFTETCRQELTALPSLSVLIKQVRNGANIIEFFASEDEHHRGFQEIYANLFAANILNRGNTRALLPRTAKLVQNDIDRAIQNYRTSFITSHDANTNAPSNKYFE